MSDNLFEEYVNGLDDEAKPSSQTRRESIQIETWEGKIIDAWRDEVIGEDYQGNRVYHTNCSACGVDCYIIEPTDPYYCLHCQNNGDKAATDEEHIKTFKETWAGLWNFVMSAMPTPVWMRVCSLCGRMFASENWRADHCSECGGVE